MKARAESKTETPAAPGTAAEPSPQRGGLAIRRRDALGLVVMLAVIGALTAMLFGGPPAARTPDGSTATQTASYAGLTVGNPKQAPPLALDNYLGTPVNLAGYRGRAVLVTFLYTHCPDICPLITTKLHTALTEMSARERREVAIVAVSVDPRGDTPATVAQFLAAHEMTGQMQYLIGSAQALGAVWANWGIGSTRDAANPSVIAHTALVYGITARGRIVTIYPETFTPREIVHDVPLLASQ